MLIDQNLYNIRVDSDIILYFLSKTKMKNAVVLTATLFRDCGDYINLKLSIEHPHSNKMSLDIWKYKITSKLRNIKLEYILGE